MNKRILRGLLAAVLGFSLAARGAAPVLAASRDYVRTYDTVGNAIVYTISSNAGDRVTINCNDVANSLMVGLTEPGQASQVAVRFVNNSDQTYIFEDYEITTVNDIDRDVPVQSPGVTTVPSYTIRTAPPTQTGAITAQRGFDGNLIPYSMTVLRSVTQPLKDVYGVRHSADVSLLQVVNLEDRLAQLGYDSYADYLLDYYKTGCTDPTHNCRRATSLMELHPSHQCEILGSNTFGYTGQSEIRQPRSIPISELQTNPDYYDFRVFGWGTRVTGPEGERQVEQDYEIMETDPEIIALGYRYLYAYGLFLSFDGTGINLPTSAEQLTLDNLELWSYMNRLDSVQDQVRVLKSIQLGPGESMTLSNVTLEVQLPNSYDMRAMDFGFSLTFVTGEKTDPEDPDNPVDPDDPDDPDDPGDPDDPDDSGDPDDPDNPDVPQDPDDPGDPNDPDDPPKTGDEARLHMWLAVLGTAVLLLIFVKRKMGNELRK